MFDAGRNGRTIVRREKARAGLGNISHHPPVPSFPKPVGDGTAVEEEERGEEGGAGAEVPDVQDGANQGQAPQLPVVTREKRSFL